METQANEILEALRASKLKGPGPQSYTPNQKEFYVRQSPKLEFK